LIQDRKLREEIAGSGSTQARLLCGPQEQLLRLQNLIAGILAAREAN
jgi:hypothetical protein